MTTSKNKNKGVELYKRIPCPVVGPGWTRVVKEHPDGTRYCNEYHSPELKRKYRGLEYANACQLAISSASKYNGEEWLSTRW